MKKNKWKISSTLLIALSIILIGFNVYAHSGRTDSNGGHRDNKNKSGLGSYHYHCGGYPAHLHTNGICPYSSSKKYTSSSKKYKTKIKINKTKYTMNKGQKYTLKISGTKKKVVWSTSNKKVATVNSKGKVTAKKSGTATITAKIGSKKYKCKISVKIPSINKTKICIAKGDTYTLKVKNTNQKIKWSSSDKKVATVNSKGKVTAKKKGTATITAKVGNKKLKCKVTIETMSISKTKITLEKENTYILKINDTKQTVKWSSSDKSIVTVNSKGKIIAKDEGTATIIAKVGEKKLKCKVTVVLPDYRKKVSTSYIQLPDGDILVSIKNNSEKKLDSVCVDVKFYKNGSLIGSRTAYTICLTSGNTAYDVVMPPYNSKYNALDYDKIEILVTETNIYKYVPYTDLSKNVSITSNRSSEYFYGVIGEFTNIGSKEIESANIGVIYYKDNKIVGYDYTYVSDVSAGATKTIKFSNPYDNNYNEIEFDSYKIVLNYAYED